MATKEVEVPEEVKKPIVIPKRADVAALTQAAQVRTEREANRVFTAGGEMFLSFLTINKKAAGSELGQMIMG